MFHVKSVCKNLAIISIYKIHEKPHARHSLKFSQLYRYICLDASKYCTLRVGFQNCIAIKSNDV